MKIRILGTWEECNVAADRIARILDARWVSRVEQTRDSTYDKPEFIVRIEARLRERDSEDLL